MKFRKIATAGMMATVCAGALLTGSVPAQAHSGQAFCVAPTAGMDGCFYAGDDSFAVADNLADGKATTLEWSAHDGSGRTGKCVDSNGSLNGWTYCDENFREGKNHYLNVDVVSGAGSTPPLVAWVSGR
ncbi:hypothetical protein [Streptomyces winkii]|uniref:hypothetical protein n=1 Tax=Streptomyces winkii TaxID=3051178 RepID=UPI0028D254C4|nr:hypothetical protein [Streptomyces sp. DSM 40971]